MVVLDEADEMLDMGFADDIESILDATPNEHQTVMFSATMPPRINAIAKRHLNDPVRINVVRGDAKASKGTVRQMRVHRARAAQARALGRVLDIEAPGGALVFCRTRTEVDQLTETMNGRGYRAEALHGGMDQAQRDRVMNRLRDGTAELLVATDVAARGLDVDTLTHVVNYDVPSAPESYVHRIGRVGRAGREGVAITLAEPREQRLLKNIERLTKQTDRHREGAVHRRPAYRAARADRRRHPRVAGGRRPRRLPPRAPRAAPRSHERNDRPRRDPPVPRGRGQHGRRARDPRRVRPPAPARAQEVRPRKQPRTPASATARSGSTGAGAGFIYVGVGRKAGIRPNDLVGAIANETGLTGREIGPIRITDTYSVVGVPEPRRHVIEKMASTTLRGKRARVRRYTD